MGQHLIYALCDPRPGEMGQIRYVGLSTKGLKRPMSHWKNRTTRDRLDRCHSWVRAVLAENLEPQIEILEEFSDSKPLPEAEMFWIAYLRSVGFRLTNMNDGGLGQLNPSLETRRKQSEANIGNTNGRGRRGKHYMTVEQRAKVGDFHRGKKMSVETRLKMSLSHRGKAFSVETREKLSRARRGVNTIARVSRECFACQKNIELRITDRRNLLPRVFCSLSCAGKLSWSSK